MDLSLHEAHMRRCLALGRVALLAGEVPVGSLVARGAEILGEGLEGERGSLDPSAHAEVQGVRAACRPPPGRGRTESSDKVELASNLWFQG